MMIGVSDGFLPVSLEALIVLMPVWLLVLFRLMGIFVFAPLFSSRMIPPQVKIFLALGMSFSVFPMLLAAGKTPSVFTGSLVESGFSLWIIGPAVAAEMLIGTVIGYGATLPLVGMQLGGRIVSQQLGLGLAEVFNPSEEQSGLISQFFYLFGLSLFIILGGHRMLWQVLVGSFDRVPLAGAIVGGDMARLVIGLLSTSYELALRVAAPLLCLIFLETVAMGFIARTVPQMNILSIGFSVRILAGISILIGAVGVVSNVFVDTMSQTLQMLSSFFMP